MAEGSDSAENQYAEALNSLSINDFFKTVLNFIKLLYNEEIYGHSHFYYNIQNLRPVHRSELLVLVREMMEVTAMAWPSDTETNTLAGLASVLHDVCVLYNQCRAPLPTKYG